MRTSSTSKVTKQHVIALLNEYAELKQKINLLEYELKCSALSGEELIEAMALRPLALNGVSVNGGAVSDPTVKIATEYERILIGMDEETKAAVESELRVLQATVDRVDFYVHLLPPEQAEVIRGYYMEGKTWPELEKQFDKSVRTLSDHRDKGIEALARMFQYIGSRTTKTRKSDNSVKEMGQM